MPSRFNANSTAEEVADGLNLRGLTYVVTGSSSGLGEETARVLAKAGGTIVMVARDPDKNDLAMARIRDEVPTADLTQVNMDLADLSTVRRAAGDILARFPKIDCLINNAGYLGGPRRITPEGAELHFAINHIGPFLFTNLLVPALRAAASSRIVMVASNAHRARAFDLDDLDFSDRPYDYASAYAQSKRATVLYTVALASRLKGTGIGVNVLHPGVILTDAFRNLSSDDRTAMVESGKQYGVIVKSLEEGAATQVWAATAPELRGVTATYLEDCQIAPHIPSTEITTKGVIEEALDPIAADRLWEISEQTVGEQFTFSAQSHGNSMGHPS